MFIKNKIITSVSKTYFYVTEKQQPDISSKLFDFREIRNLRSDRTPNFCFRPPRPIHGDPDPPRIGEHSHPGFKGTRSVQRKISEKSVFSQILNFSNNKVSFQFKVKPYQEQDQ